MTGHASLTRNTHCSRRWPVLAAVILVAMLAVICLHVRSVRADGSSRYVDGASGVDSGDCSSIAAACATISYAIAQSSDQDTIFISEGEYVENLHIDMGGSLMLIGGHEVNGSQWSPSPVGFSRVDGDGADTVVDIRATNVRIEHMVIHNGHGVDDPTFGAGCGGFKVQDSDLTLRNTIIVGNYAGVGAGGAICSAGDARLNTVLVYDSMIVNNDGEDEGGALNLWHTDAYLENTLIVGNTAGRGAVLLTYPDDGADSTVIFRNCTIADNMSTQPAAMIISNPNRVELWNSIVWGNGDNVDFGGGDCNSCIVVRHTDIEYGWTGLGNLTEDPLFKDPGSDYRLFPQSPCVDAGINDDAPDHDLDGDPRPIDGDLDGTATTDMGAFELPEPAGPARYVSGDGGADSSDCSDPADPCETINYAIGQAVDGDIVHIAQGVYAENVVVDGLSLGLAGGFGVSGSVWYPGSGETTIDGGGLDRSVVLRNGNSVLMGLTITGGQSPPGECWAGGVLLLHGEFGIYDSIIRGNHADCSGGGLSASSGVSSLIIEDSKFIDNSSDLVNGGLAVWHTNAELTNVLFAGNSAPSGGSAIGLTDGNAVLQNVTAGGNTGSYAVYGINQDGQPDMLTVRNSILYGNAGGDLDCSVLQCDVTYSDVDGGSPGTGNIDQRPQFVYPAAGDFHLLPGSPCIDAGTNSETPDHDLDGVSRPQDGDLDGTATTDMGAYELPEDLAVTLFVDDATGQDKGNCRDSLRPCKTIGYALGYVGDGSTMLIASGFYDENLRIDMGGDLKLRGGYDVSHGIWTPSAWDLSEVSGGNRDTVIDIRDTNVEIQQLAVVEGHGRVDPTFGDGCAGFKIQNGDVSLRRMVIERNHVAVGEGGAICAAGDSRLITLTVEESVIRNNDGGFSAGALNLFHADTYVVNTVIANNTAQNAAVLVTHNNPDAESQITFMNCTILDNSSAVEGAMALSSPSRIELWNTIFWGNGEPAAFDNCLACVDVEYSDVEGGWTGATNIDADPLLVDPDHGRYGLTLNSPCVDAGTNAGAPAWDFLHDPRPLDGDGDGVAVTDMGVDELVLIQTYLPTTMR